MTKSNGEPPTESEPTQPAVGPTPATSPGSDANRWFLLSVKPAAAFVGFSAALVFGFGGGTNGQKLGLLGIAGAAGLLYGATRHSRRLAAHRAADPLAILAGVVTVGVCIVAGLLPQPDGDNETETLPADDPVSEESQEEAAAEAGSSDDEDVAEPDPRCEEAHQRIAGQDLSGCELEGLSFVGGDLEGTNLTDAVIRNSSLQAVNFSGATLQGTVFESVDLAGSSFAGVNLANLSFHTVTCTSEPVDLLGAIGNPGLNESPDGLCGWGAIIASDSRASLRVIERDERLVLQAVTIDFNVVNFKMWLTFDHIAGGYAGEDDEKYHAGADYLIEVEQLWQFDPNDCSPTADDWCWEPFESAAPAPRRDLRDAGVVAVEWIIGLGALDCDGDFILSAKFDTAGGVDRVLAGPVSRGECEPAGPKVEVSDDTDGQDESTAPFVEPATGFCDASHWRAMADAYMAENNISGSWDDPDGDCIHSTYETDAAGAGHCIDTPDCNGDGTPDGLDPDYDSGGGTLPSLSYQASFLLERGAWAYL